MNWPNKDHRAGFLAAVAGTPGETAVRALLHRIDELEREPRPVQVKLTRADVEEAAEKLFSWPGTAPISCLRRFYNDGSNSRLIGADLFYTDVVHLLCESLGVQ